MADETLSRDQNFVTVLGAITDDVAQEIRMLRVDPATGRLLVSAIGVGAGTVTDVSVVSANGFAGTVATSTTTPAITLTTTVNAPVLAGNGTAIAAATTTGSGSTVVLQDTPTLTTPILGVATATTINKVTITAPAASATLTIANGKTLTVSNSGTLAGGDAFVLAIAAAKTLTVSNTLTFTGTDSSSVAFGTGGTVLYTTSAIPLTVGTTTIASGSNTNILYNNSGVLGEYTITGSGTVVVMATAPTFATSITTPTVLATANDSGALGAAATAFSDLFLASGALIGFANGNVVITHSSAVLTVSTGDLRVTTAGTDSASVVTVGGTQTLTSKSLTSPSITTATLNGANVLAENASIQLDPAGSADGKYSGVTMTGTAGATVAFGDLLYLDSATSRWKLTDCDSATTSDRMIAMAVSASTDGNPVTLLLMGVIRADSKFPALTIGSAVVVGETAGEIQVAIPTGADNVIKRVGYALTADEIYFNPSQDSQVTVA